MPAPYLHIACCIEHESPAARLALAEARSLRGSGPARLSLVHVSELPIVPIGFPPHMMPSPPEDPAEVREWAMSWLRPMAEGDEQPVVLDGDPPVAVCDWAAANGVDLIVAASHRGFLERVLLGSFATYLAQHASCPVLLVRPATPE